MSIFTNGTGKYLEDALNRGIASVKDFFDIDQNATRGEAHKLKVDQTDEEFIKNDEEKEPTSFFSNLFGGFFGGDSSDDSGNDSHDDSSSYGGRDPGQDMQDAYDRQERDNRQREDYERQSRNDDER